MKTIIMMLAFVAIASSVDARERPRERIETPTACCEEPACPIHGEGITWIDELNEIGIDCVITQEPAYLTREGIPIIPSRTCECSEFAAE